LNTYKIVKNRYKAALCKLTITS